MEKIANAADALNLQDNYFCGTVPAGIEECPVILRGKGNTLFCEEGVTLSKPCQIVFEGDNATIVLRKSSHSYRLNAHVYHNCVLFFGSDNYFNGALNLTLSEGRYLLVGNDCLFSFGDWIRTADPHLVYDAESKQRINPSKDVFIGDHVWLGQDVMLLKGTTIGSGSIIGAKSVIAGKRIGSNASWAGNPAKRIRGGLFWEGSCVHTWNRKKTKEHAVYESDEFIFSKSEDVLSWKSIAKDLRKLKGSQEKLSYIQDNLFVDGVTNRFYIPDTAPAKPTNNGTFIGKLANKLRG